MPLADRTWLDNFFILWVTQWLMNFSLDEYQNPYGGSERVTNLNVNKIY